MQYFYSQASMKGLPFKLQDKPPASQSEHPALQNIKMYYFFLFVGYFCFQGSGSTDPSESGSRPDLYETALFGIVTDLKKVNGKLPNKNFFLQTF
jgi:hypothetical protein